MIDPVCGAEVGEGSEPVKGPDGKEYRFCCASCRWAFEQDPGSFVKGG